jgi:hypothetical protein
VLSTLDPAGPYGGPVLSASATRNFPLAGRCGIPATAVSVSVNVTITQPTFEGYLKFFSSGAAPPLVSAINYKAGATRANNAVVPTSLAVQVGQATGTTHFILDVNGYFQ